MKQFLICDLLTSYRQGTIRPTEFFNSLMTTVDERSPPNTWIHRLPRERVLEYARSLENRDPHDLPLYGIPFAIKDNIDLLHAPTTAACPAFAYQAQQSAQVVQLLVDAGAVPIGKTNLDQFATGLVGTRSPYGACVNAFDPKFISGGSSSGSAVAVALGLVSFALGTDTAGSGRIPAAFNNIVGLKPTKGRISTRGVVPACRSLDCVSIFAGTADCAARVLEVAGWYDPADPFARETYAPHEVGRLLEPTLSVGVPRRDQLDFYGDAEYERLFHAAVTTLQQQFGTVTDIDFEPFAQAAELLYEGPWIAERYAAIQTFIESDADKLYPVTRTIIEAGHRRTAVQAFNSMYRLQALQREAHAALKTVDVLMVPTAGTIYRIDEVAAQPIQLNSNLGRYTNFVNLLDLAAVAVPAGFRTDGLPFGVTLIGRAGSDEALLALAAKLHAALVRTIGATGVAVPANDISAPDVRQGFIPVVVCGAHMAGLPLNHQLRDRHAYFVRATRTAPVYRFHALAGGPPKRPGLVRVSAHGAAVDVEIWAVPEAHFGSFVAGIPAPLGIGKVQLEDGTEAPGFLCETEGLLGARDISDFGGWRAFIAAS